MWLDPLIENDGIIFTKNITDLGIPRIYLNKLIEEELIERIRSGVYISKDAFDDDMYILQVKYNRIIFSHETALYLHNLTDRDPIQYSVTVPTGYNRRPLKSNGLCVLSIKEELFHLGITEISTMYGRKIRCYNMERTLCDILRSRNQMDISVVTDALKQYSHLKTKNLPLLMRYSKIFRIEKILRSYLEVLL